METILYLNAEAAETDEPPHFPKIFGKLKFPFLTIGRSIVNEYCQLLEFYIDSPGFPLLLRHFNMRRNVTVSIARPRGHDRLFINLGDPVDYRLQEDEYVLMPTDAYFLEDRTRPAFKARLRKGEQYAFLHLKLPSEYLPPVQGNRAAKEDVARLMELPDISARTWETLNVRMKRDIDNYLYVEELSKVKEFYLTPFIRSLFLEAINTSIKRNDLLSLKTEIR